MAHDPFRNALILTGPTGSGKSSLALRLAERLGAEVVAMDSMTLYRGLDIGTAKPTPEERRRVPHHLLDVLDPWESANVAWWREQAALCCRDIEARGRKALVVGGTPFYLKALLYGLFDGPTGDTALRARLGEEAERYGPQMLHQRLAAVDAAAAARLHPHDVRRVIRALEVWELTGRPISAWQRQWDAPRQGESENFKYRCLYLDLPREPLYARINDRVLQMFAAGWEDEARALRRLPRPLSREASQALGYRELFQYLDGKLSRPEAVRLIQQRCRNFAKRQLTWFRNLPECIPTTEELTFTRWGLTMVGT